MDTVVTRQPQGSVDSCQLCVLEKRKDKVDISHFCTRTCCVLGVFSGCYLTPSGAGFCCHLLGVSSGAVGCGIFGALCCTPLVEMSLQRVCTHGPKDESGIACAEDNEDNEDNKKQSQQGVLNAKKDDDPTKMSLQRVCKRGPKDESGIACAEDNEDNKKQSQQGVLNAKKDDDPTKMSLQRVCEHGPKDEGGIAWAKGNKKQFQQGFLKAMTVDVPTKRSAGKPQEMPVIDSSDGELKPPKGMDEKHIKHE